MGGCTTQSGPDDRFPVETILVDEGPITVWVADQPASRARGLMGITELPGGIEGMLFVWESPAPRTFHMTDTLIPLDIWWFDSDGVLIGSTAMEPCQVTTCPTYPSPGDVLRALETPAGRHHFEVGALLATGR